MPLSVSLNSTPVRGVHSKIDHVSSGNQTVKLMQELTDYRQLLAARDSTIQELSKFKVPVNKLRKVIENQMQEIITLNKSLHASRNELKAVRVDNEELKKKLINAHEQLDHVAESQRVAQVEKVEIGTNTEVSVSFIRGVVNESPPVQAQSVALPAKVSPTKVSPIKFSPRGVLSTSDSTLSTGALANSQQHFERPRDPRRDSAISVPDLDFFETPLHELAPASGSTNTSAHASSHGVQQPLQLLPHDNANSQPLRRTSSSSSNAPAGMAHVQQKVHQFAAGISAPHLIRPSPSASPPPMSNLSHVPNMTFRTSPAAAHPVQQHQLQHHHQQIQHQQQFVAPPNLVQQQGARHNVAVHQQAVISRQQNFSAAQPIAPAELAAVGVSSPQQQSPGQASPVPVCKVTSDPALSTVPIPNAPPSTPAVNGSLAEPPPEDQLETEVARRFDDLAETVPILPSPESVATLPPQVRSISFFNILDKCRLLQ